MLPIEHTKYRNTVKFNFKAPGLYNFIKGFVWAYKRGGGRGGGGWGAGGNQKNNFMSFIVPIQVATVLQNVLIHKTGLYPGGKAYIQNNE